MNISIQNPDLVYIGQGELIQDDIETKKVGFTKMLENMMHKEPLANLDQSILLSQELAGKDSLSISIPSNVIEDTDNYINIMKYKSPFSIYPPIVIYKISEISTQYPDFFGAYLKSQTLPVNSKNILISQAQIFNNMRLVNKYELATWKTYFKFRYYIEYSNVLNYLMIENKKSVLSGVKVRNIIGELFSDELGRMCFNERLTADMPFIHEMIENIINTYKRKIQSGDWINNEYKEYLIQKLSKLHIEIGYPYRVERKGYSALTLRHDDPLGNAMKMKEFDYLYEFNNLTVRRGGVHTAWNKKNYNVQYDIMNAFYVSEENMILIPLPIIMRFLVKNDNASSYGGLGFTIAHEIAHSLERYDSPSVIRTILNSRSKNLQA